MSNPPDLSSFKSLIGTAFRAGRSGILPEDDPTADPPEGTVLHLVKVTEKDAEEYTGVSLIFHGPADKFLPQKTYCFRHETLGDFDMFVVPVGELKERRDGSPTRTGFVYQAVFTRLKEGL
jgi:hypothetical protein